MTMPTNDARDAQTDAPEKRRKAGPGRAVGLTPRIQQIICDAIAAGNYQKVAAQAAGISESILMKWRARGRRGEEPYASLNAAIVQADIDCETALVAKVMAASSDDWRAAAMMLERKYPERWSRMREREGFAVLGREGSRFAIGSFQVIIHAFDEKKWDEQVRQRRLALIPAASVEDAQAIEIVSPSTKV